jgi:hypothetical protein
MYFKSGSKFFAVEFNDTIFCFEWEVHVTNYIHIHNVDISKKNLKFLRADPVEPMLSK